MHSTFVAVFFSLFSCLIYAEELERCLGEKHARSTDPKKKRDSFLFHALAPPPPQHQMTPLGTKPKSPRLLESSFKMRRGKPT